MHRPSDGQQKLLLLRRFLDPGTKACFLQRFEPLLLHALVGPRRHLGLDVHELVVGRARGVGPQLERARDGRTEKKERRKSDVEKKKKTTGKSQRLDDGEGTGE